jgi:hypothetical protein
MLVHHVYKHPTITNILENTYEKAIILIYMYNKLTIITKYNYVLFLCEYIIHIKVHVWKRKKNFSLIDWRNINSQKYIKK